MSISGAVVSFCLEDEVHPAINIKAVNETTNSGFFFMILIFAMTNLKKDIAKVNIILIATTWFGHQSSIVLHYHPPLILYTIRALPCLIYNLPL